MWPNSLFLLSNSLKPLPFPELMLFYPIFLCTFRDNKGCLSCSEVRSLPLIGKPSLGFGLFDPVVPILFGSNSFTSLRLSVLRPKLPQFCGFLT